MDGPVTLSQPMDVYLGCYTQPAAVNDGSGAGGITLCALDPSRGRLVIRALAAEMHNPSYLALDQTCQYLLAVSENIQAEGAVYAFRRHTDGGLTPMSFQPSGGRSSCHVCATREGLVCVSSYGDGRSTFYSLRQGIISSVEHQHGYQAHRQTESKKNSRAHQAVAAPNGKWLYVCDLGLDCIWRHALADAKAIAAAPVAFATPDNYGPRHMVFHPVQPRAYAVCEHNGHLLTWHWNSTSGDLVLLDDAVSLPAAWTGQPAAAAIAIHPSLQALYVSNRNHDSLAFFRLDSTGRATLAGHVAAGGKTPRDFAIDPSGRWLLCANQHSNHIAIHALDETSGLPTQRPPELVSTRCPACVLFAAPRGPASR